MSNENNKRFAHSVGRTRKAQGGVFSKYEQIPDYERGTRQTATAAHWARIARIGIYNRCGKADRE